MESFANNLETYLNGSIFIAAFVAYIGGVLTSFTPCVYPLIPITSSYVTSQTMNQKGKLNAFFLSLAYVLGVSIVYSVLGVIAAMTGDFFGNVSTSPVSLVIVGNVMVLLGLSMLDVFYLQAPAFIRNIGGGNKKRKGIFGAVMLGMVSGVVVAPCTAPPLGMILTYVATTKNAVLGGSVLFTFSVGMGTLLIIAGTFSGIISNIPKSGNWMIYIKKALGVIMILTGEYFVFQAGQLWL